jgi:hypothetical protein
MLTVKTEGGGWLTADVRRGTFAPMNRRRAWLEVVCYKSDGSGRGVKVDAGPALLLLFRLGLGLIGNTILSVLKR